MSDTTIPAVPTQDVTLTLAQQARVNLIMLSLAARDTASLKALSAKAFVTAMGGVTMKEFAALHDVATERRAKALLPLGARVPPAKPFSHHTHSVEIDESAEAHLARGNQAWQMQDYDRAHRSYLAALKATERA